ncbi:MAG: acyl-CoA dehydrogenase [Acidimicrobiales bacterium]|jgi:alkylation response protein AidB-like acyl-CoA dehydrogenase|nr:acyl-CoA dehydrogenase [Acidimicrobiales bacterium]
MSNFVVPTEDMKFALDVVGRIGEISKLNGFQHLDTQTVGDIIDEAGRFFTEVIAPLNRVGDEQGSTLDDGAVTSPEGFKEAYRAYIDAGWAAAQFPEEWGGGGLPYTVGLAINEMFKTANMAFSLCPMLTHSAVEALLRHGSDEQKALYLEKLVTGEWTGTMHLTEPQSGSDLGSIRARAVPQEDGTYRIFGTKIFITWGDHDLTDNIVHFVLAKTPDAPAGTKGISMFLVPKYLPDADGSPGERNDYRIVSIEHKLGIHASPTCVVSFGDGGEGAVGWMVGNEFEGMRNMFTMMNTARIGVGIEGLALTERSYQQSLAYARERIQGRRPGGTEEVPIIEHPDVKRMLLTMKASAEAMRALIYHTALHNDLAHHADDETTRRNAASTVALLTPVVKAWCTDLGVEMTSVGIQVHGGMGFIEETGVAQHYRDARIAPIYEGTNGIQAIDLVLRKLPLDGGDAVSRHISGMTEVMDRMHAHPDLEVFRDRLTSAIQGLVDTTEWLSARLGAGETDVVLAGATPYLRQFGLVTAGWLMAVQAVAAREGVEGYDPEFLEAKVANARFYGEHLLPMASGLVPTIKAGTDFLDAVR